MIEEAYAKDNYETNLLVNQLKPISDIFNLDKTTIYIIDTKEKFEIIKKLIEHYLNFIVQINFTSISKIHYILSISERFK